MGRLSEVLPKMIMKMIVRSHEGFEPKVDGEIIITVSGKNSEGERVAQFFQDIVTMLKKYNYSVDGETIK